MLATEDILGSINRLVHWIESQEYNGYDPYDALSSSPLQKLTLKSKWLRSALTHSVKQCPFNIRPLLHICKKRNTNGVAVIAASYIKLFTMTSNVSYLERAVNLLYWLEDHANSNYAGLGWGRNDYDFQSSAEYMPRFEPLTFLTALVANVFLDAYEVTKDNRYIDVARSACDFILNEPNVYQNNNGICFSYTLHGNNRIFNATMVAGACMARVYHHTKENVLFDTAKKTVDYVISEQNSNGSWYYGYTNDGKVRKQIDFHQGFVLSALYDFIEYAKPQGKKYMDALLKGAEFYKDEQFLPDGRAKWRWPKIWPIDIHNQSEGIIAFSRLSKIESAYLDSARTIAKWTIENMQDRTGYFYYQRYKHYFNKIPYMRWSQAWMFKALVCLAEALGSAINESGVVPRCASTSSKHKISVPGRYFCD